LKSKIEVLVCDDSALMRKLLKEIINSDPLLNVCGTARDGKDAVIKARELKPDVITMDINMPGLDGITALQIITEEKIAPVIMVSSLTQEGALTTFEALELGAFDYVAKPGGTVSTNIKAVSDELIRKIKAAAGVGILEKLNREKLKRTSRPESGVRIEKQVALHKKKAPKLGYKAVAIGISTGGPKTIFDVLPYLPEDLNAAVFLVQHMPPTFTSSFAKRIDSASKLKCVEVEAGMEVKRGVIYLARGGRHLTLFKKTDGHILIRTPSKPEHLFIPSVDVMMESVLSVFGQDTVGVLMTGMGDDGADAMVKIREAGGITIAESEESAIVFGMPGEAIRRGGADIVAPSWEIAEEIIKAVG